MPAAQPSRVSLPPVICEAGRRAVVTSPADHTAWSTRIASPVSDDVIAVFAPRDQDGPVRRYAGALLTLEIPTELALYRLPCTLLEQQSNGPAIWKLGEFQEIERIQRRTAHRFRGYFNASLAVRPHGRPAQECPLPVGLTRNLSTTGCFLQSPVKMPLRTPVQVSLRLDPQRVWTLTGEIVRAEARPDGVHGIGIHFFHPDREAQLAISRFISSAERFSQHPSLLA